MKGFAERWDEPRRSRAPARLNLLTVLSSDVSPSLT